MLYDAESCKPSQRAYNVSSMTFTWALDHVMWGCINGNCVKKSTSGIYVS